MTIEPGQRRKWNYDGIKIIVLDDARYPGQHLCEWPNGERYWLDDEYLERVTTLVAPKLSLPTPPDQLYAPAFDKGMGVGWTSIDRATVGCGGRLRAVAVYLFDHWVDRDGNPIPGDRVEVTG